MGTYIRWLLGKTCARKMQSVILSFKDIWLDRGQQQIGNRICFSPKRPIFFSETSNELNAVSKPPCLIFVATVNFECMHFLLQSIQLFKKFIVFLNFFSFI